ncbi:DUF6441 family protein [Azospirillum doebereinerae]|uniref:Uncharacterized protein n=1 Tax=Azospirillum doebereinerae TaxID=92933 RepID=A0A433J4V9_9PROT|nr:DUF6441 family protein [Azospirillum doebereinerae]RUQ67462.1 hypothetical protein EJ913_19765 [Azospirillum doebereinerae]
MKIVGRISGDLKELMNTRFDEIADAARAAVRSASEGLQAELRRQTVAAGLGSGLEKAWRLDLYPKISRRRTLRPAGLVYSKATRLHDAFDNGETITARGGKWLAIPLPAAKAAGLDKSPMRDDSRRASPMPAKWSNVVAATSKFGALRFVPIGNGARALLVADGKARGDTLARGGAGRATSIPLFLLVKRVRGRKLLDLAAAAKQAEAQLVANLSNILGR